MMWRAAGACLGSLSLLLGAVAYDEGEDITLCWFTNMSRPEDGPHREDCKGAHVDVTGFPDELVSDQTYVLSYRMVVPVELEAQEDVPHFNVHSCPRNIGFCTPFVADSPELATHSPALTGTITSGVGSFDNEVRLPAGQYTIIGHGRWFDRAGHKHDMARARIKDILDPPPPTPVSFYVAVSLGVFVGFLFVSGLVAGAWYMVKLYHAQMAARIKLDQDNRARVCDVIVGVQEFRYPFCATKFSAFQSFGRLLSHKECREAGHLIFLDTWNQACEFASKHCALFVSHQWMHTERPDPDNVHYPMILQAVQEVLQESGTSEDDLYIWLDYHSMPHECRASLSNAISSLSAYVPVCKLFLICAPPVKHSDGREVVDGETYLRRGWCRFEQWARLTSGGLDGMYVFRGQEVERLSDTVFEPWVRESINVFSGEYNEPGHMKELVNLTLGLWGNALLGLAATDIDRLKQEVLKDKKRVFPTKHFGELVEVLEEEISKPDSELQRRLKFVRDQGGTKHMRHGK